MYSSQDVFETILCLGKSYIDICIITAYVFSGDHPNLMYIEHSGQKDCKEILLKLNEKWLMIIIIMYETESFTTEVDLIRKR